MDFRSLDAVFWDFDGVIKDTLEIKGESFVEVYENLPLKFKQQILKYHYDNGGMPRMQKFAFWNDKYNIVSDDKKKLVLEQSIKYESIVLSKLMKCPWNEGFDLLTKEILDSDCKSFIVSGAPRKELLEILGEYAKYFVEVLGGDKSKTEHLEDIRAKYGICLEESIFIGDAESDHIAANDCSIPFILKRHSKNRHLKPGNCLVEIHSLIELL